MPFLDLWRRTLWRVWKGVNRKSTCKMSRRPVFLMFCYKYREQDVISGNLGVVWRVAKRLSRGSAKTTSTPQGMQPNERDLL